MAASLRIPRSDAAIFNSSHCPAALDGTPARPLEFPPPHPASETSIMERIGFIGLGLMGLPLCRRLQAAGFPLSVWNRSPDKLQQAGAEGLHVSASLTELAERSDILMLCVADAAAVQAVFSQLQSSLRSGQLIIDLSSIDPDTTRRCAERAKQQGASWVDAPVSGGVNGATQGTLVVMAGGRTQDIGRASQALQPLSQRITRMGEVGSGQVSKICNQLIVAANAMLIAEAVALAENNGVDASLLAPALAGGFADSLPLQILAPRMAARQAEPVQWKVATLLKDLDNAGQLSKQSQSATPLAALASQLMRLHAAQGHSNADLSSVIHLYQDKE
ncbi:NAD(P)-dependent oxidoreductase [Aquitalea sp. FJL05]|uniref:NAD(P)-dependent oxidoreductase n=1 Tax=Aquitalea sp. FJL05 TaxID=2153366 RepID=UPI001F2F1FD9|nr:NAD(P)-dependent oxidoreductase [Aquitalea sp. FJL05]